jgi:hypothetical protein
MRWAGRLCILRNAHALHMLKTRPLWGIAGKSPDFAAVSNSFGSRRAVNLDLFSVWVAYIQRFTVLHTNCLLSAAPHSSHAGYVELAAHPSGSQTEVNAPRENRVDCK